MAEYACLLGEPVFSEFRLNKLQQRLALLAGRDLHVAAHHVYLLHCSQPLAAGELLQLQDLLHGELHQNTGAGDALFVVPRMGTISPWSSKATDIVQRCGLGTVLRVERGQLLSVAGFDALDARQQEHVQAAVHDRMTQAVCRQLDDAWQLFGEHQPGALRHIAVMQLGKEALLTANRELGLALADTEIDYLVESFRRMGRDPTDAELMMFAQANSEHCRHKIFNASWTLDGVPSQHSLFGMIRNTHAQSPEGVLSAYHDNAAVLAGAAGRRLIRDARSHEYGWVTESLPFQIKVETHNHPTAISPYPGAATGSGGEIRDESATGRGV